MRPDRRAALVVAGSMAGMCIVLIWALLRDVGQSAPWLVPVAVAAALWGFVEHSRPPSHTIFLRYFMAWVAVSIASLMAVQTMAALDAPISAWAAGGHRASGIVTATGLVLFGNALPTLAASSAPESRPGMWQGIRRFIAWVLVLTGLGIGVSWIVMDPTAASRVTNRLLAICFFLVSGRSFASLSSRRGEGPTTMRRV